MTLHIAVDMDDVVVNFIGMVCDVVSRDFGVEPPVTKDDITSWNFGQFLDHHIGEDWWSWLEKHAYLWGEKAKPIPGALGGIEKLRRAGHRVELLTSKPPWAERFVWTWLERYGPVVNGVTLVPLGGDKTEWSTAQVLVDDRDKNVTEWVQSKMNREALLFFAPHNAEFTPTGLGRRRVTRVQNWDEVLTTINILEAAL